MKAKVGVRLVLGFDENTVEYGTVLSDFSDFFDGNASALLRVYVACPRIFLLFAITVFHTDEQLRWSLVLFLLVRTLVLMTKKNKSILSNIFFSLIKN